MFRRVSDCCLHYYIFSFVPCDLKGKCGQKNEKMTSWEWNWEKEWKGMRSKMEKKESWPKILSFGSIMEMLSRHRCLSAVETKPTTKSSLESYRTTSYHYILLTCIHYIVLCIWFIFTHIQLQTFILIYTPVIISVSVLSVIHPYVFLCIVFFSLVLFIFAVFLLSHFDAEFLHLMWLQHVLIIWPAVHPDRICRVFLDQFQPIRKKRHYVDWPSF